MCDPRIDRVRPCDPAPPRWARRLALLALACAACTPRGPAPEEQRTLALLADSVPAPETIVRLVIGTGTTRSTDEDRDAWAERVRTARPDLVLALHQPPDLRSRDGALVAVASATELAHLLWTPAPAAPRLEHWVLSRWVVRRAEDDTLRVGTGAEAVPLALSDPVRWGCEGDARGTRLDAASGVSLEVCAPWAVERSAGDDALAGFAGGALRVELRRVSEDEGSGQP